MCVAYIIIQIQWHFLKSHCLLYQWYSILLGSSNVTVWFWFSHRWGSNVVRLFLLSFLLLILSFCFRCALSQWKFTSGRRNWRRLHDEFIYSVDVLLELSSIWNNTWVLADFIQPFSCHWFHRSPHDWIMFQYSVKVFHRQGKEIAVCFCPYTRYSFGIGQQTNFWQMRSNKQLSDLKQHSLSSSTKEELMNIKLWNIFDIQLSFCELNSIESIEFVENYILLFWKWKLLKIVLYKFYKFCKILILVTLKMKITRKIVFHKF